MEKLKCLLFGLLLSFSLCDGAKILAVFPVPSPSHGILGDNMIKHLLNAGHEVSVLWKVMTYLWFYLRRSESTIHTLYEFLILTLCDFVYLFLFIIISIYFGCRIWLVLNETLEKVCVSLGFMMYRPKMFCNIVFIIWRIEYEEKRRIKNVL